jgi:hypothetical protein
MTARLSISAGLSKEPLYACKHFYNRGSFSMTMDLFFFLSSFSDGREPFRCLRVFQWPRASSCL